MEKKQQVGGWGIFLVLIIIIFAVITYFTKEDEKVDYRALKAQSLPVLERICENDSVKYIDRRGPSVIIYQDREGIGVVDVMEIREFDESIGKSFLIRFALTETISEAAKMNIEEISNYWCMKEICQYRNSAEAQTIQELYNKVRRAYLKLQPGQYPENADTLIKVRPDKVKVFFGLLSEHLAWDRQECKVKTQRASEIVQLKAYLAFKEMRVAYRGLNLTEKRLIFSGRKLPKNIIMPSKVGLYYINGIVSMEYDPRGFFEDDLMTAYMETDYMSGWSISGTELERKIVKQYYQSLRTKGLKEGG